MMSFYSFLPYFILILYLAQGKLVFYSAQKGRRIILHLNISIFHSLLLILKSLLGDPLKICTDDLTIPKITRYNEIDCKFTAIQEVESCKNPKKCVPSSAGAIALKNCRPGKNETVTTMLMSFQRQGESKSMIITEDIVHLVFRVYDSDQKGKFKLLTHQIKSSKTKDIIR